jgi:outer membrane immunogenic protein
MQQHDKFGGGVTVKKLLLAGLATSALIAPAMAADMPVPAAPTTTWTGFYVGVNGGWGLLANGSVNSVGAPNNCSDVASAGCFFFPVFNNIYSNASAAAATFSTSKNSNGGYLAGGQFGYNYQTTANTVVGLEADLQASGQNHTFTFNSVTQVPGFPVNPITQTATITTKLDFLGTIRASGGYLWDPNFLTYITAGLAYGQIELSSSITQNVPGAAPEFTPYTGVGTSKVVRFGGTIGAGLEWMVMPHWSVRAEYLYVGLGLPTVNSLLTNPSHNPIILGGPNGNLSSATVITSARFDDNIVRAGVNYRF